MINKYLPEILLATVGIVLLIIALGAFAFQGGQKVVNSPVGQAAVKAAVL